LERLSQIYEKIAPSKEGMDSRMVAAIELDGNGSTLVGLFANHQDKKIYLQNAFFRSNPALVFPAVVISESSVRTIKRLSAEEADAYYGTSGEEIPRTDSSLGTHGPSKAKEIAEHKPDLSQTKPSRSDTRGWNQFEANMRLFNVKPDFDEREYTEVLDKNSEAYKSKLQMAKRVEQEILSSATSDSHRLEERGMKAAADDDLAYSTVIADKHTKGRVDDDLAYSAATGDKRSRGKAGRKTDGARPKHGEESMVEPEPARDMVRPQPAKQAAPAGDKISENVANEARKKMIVEVEGLDIREAEALEAKAKKNGEHGSKAGGAVEKTMPVRRGSPKEAERQGESGGRKAADAAQKRSVTFGWLNPKFESMKAVADMIQSKFSGNFELPEKGSKWGAGTEWEPLARNIISRSIKFAKSSSIIRSMARQSPVPKQ
jgi:PAB1-binding protein PBP1